jgi:RNA polymerase sigma factor (sigma-70 family)
MGVVMSRGTSAIATVARPAREYPDGQLVAATRRGDDAAFEQLYERYRGPISGYVQRMCKDHARAEDITQEVFMSALRRMRDTDRPIAFKPWVYEIARNACIDQFRRSQRGEEISYDAADRLPGADHLRLVTRDASPDDAFDTKERLDHLCGAFGGLSETHHRILVLRELEGLSYREIGEQLGMSRPAVESTLFRARRRLTEEYDELVTGRRCARVQSIIAGAAEGMLGVRDRRRLARHLSYCQPCRRHARMLGVDAPSRSSIGAKVGAVLPLPFVRRRGIGTDSASPAGGQASGALAQWTASAGVVAEPLTNWAKTAVTVAAVAIAGVGAGVTAHNGALSQLLTGGDTARHAPARQAPASAVVVSGASAVVPSADHGPGAARAGSSSGGPGARGPGGALVGDTTGGSHAADSAGAPRVDLPSGASGAGSGAPSLPDVHAPDVPAAGTPSPPAAQGNASPPRVDPPSAPFPPPAPDVGSAPKPPSLPPVPSTASAPRDLPKLLT